MPPTLRLLVVGGTQFVGRHIVTAALDRGHEVTLLHRGRTGDDLFPDATHVHADRDGDLTAVPELTEGSWDATVDVSAYVPRQVRALGAALGGRAGRYLYVSTVSVYDPPAPDFDEDAPLLALDDPTTEQVTAETYGGLKALCEHAARGAFAALTVVRPTYVVGPWDHTGRFTYWVRRIARGGEVLVPGPADAPVQVVDARDQAAFVVSLVERGIDGTFSCCTPAPPYGLGDLLAAVVAEVAPPGTALTWVSPEFLHAHDVPASALPLWHGGAREPVGAASPGRAYAAGLTPRPLARTIRDTLDHEPTPLVDGVGLDAEREAELLAAWHTDGR